MTTVALYRILIPGHAEALHPAITDVVVETFIEFATRRLASGAFGQLYQEALVYWVAHCIQVSPGFVTGEDAVSPMEVGPLTQVKDDTFQRGYGQVNIDPSVSHTDQALMNTWYGRKYLDIRNSRTSTMPQAVQVGIISGTG